MNLDSYNCELCALGVEETTEHLFLHCPFAQQCWGLISLATSLDSGTLENFTAFKDQINSQFFMVAIILMCWTIWLARNELIFNENQVTIQECTRIFLKEARLVSLRVTAYQLCSINGFKLQKRSKPWPFILFSLFPSLSLQVVLLPLVVSPSFSLFLSFSLCCK